MRFENFFKTGIKSQPRACAVPAVCTLPAVVLLGCVLAFSARAQAQNEQGACCVDIDDGPLAYDTCVVNSGDSCGNGTFQGQGSTCTIEGCCLGGVYCQATDPECCIASGGVPLGPGSDCSAGCEQNLNCPLLLLESPLPDPCQDLQQTDCQTNGPNDQFCLPSLVRVAALPPGPFVSDVLECACGTLDVCGAMLVSGDILSCQGLCSQPPAPDQDCQIFINDEPTGEASVDAALLLPDSLVTCGCAPPAGEACCALEANVTCHMFTPEECVSFEGTSMGPSSVCLGHEACCLTGGACTFVDRLCCEEVAGGIPLGPDSMCGGLGVCCQDIDDGPLAYDACGQADGACCEAGGGVFGGIGTICESEACCLPGGFCQDADPRCCVESGGQPQGEGSTCLDDGNGNDIDDACENCLSNLDCEDGAPCTMDICDGNGTCAYPPRLFCDHNFDGQQNIVDVVCAARVAFQGATECAGFIISQDEIDTAPAPCGDGQVNIIDVIGAARAAFQNMPDPCCD